MNRKQLTLYLFFFLLAPWAWGQEYPATLVAVDSGWAANSVNTVIFRKNALVSRGDTQFIAFYDAAQRVVVGKRKRGSDQWVLAPTGFKGKATDAHNSISLMVDGSGYLHLAWDHHNHPLRYSRSLAPGSLSFGSKQAMTGLGETRVSYPEFYRLPSGDLIFLYRDGASGEGNLVINHYDHSTGTWEQRHRNLVDGEKKRNAYWQAYVDSEGTIHLSWTWRESPNVASNHDLCYARSKDGGRTWQRSDGRSYALPITAATAETIVNIPQGSELINQTSMTAGSKGEPFIATYWKDSNSTIPQYRIIFRKRNKWKVQTLSFRQTSFSLSGTGTRKIPVARPQLVCWKQKGKNSLALIFRDEERGGTVSVALVPDLDKASFFVKDLHPMKVGSWEPNLDTELWKEHGALHLFVQYNEQVSGEGVAALPAQMIYVMETTIHQMNKKR